MPHWSENSQQLRIISKTISSIQEFSGAVSSCDDVALLRLPVCPPNRGHLGSKSIGELVASAASRMGPKATLVSVGDIIDLVEIQGAAPASFRYQSLVAIKKSSPVYSAQGTSLANQHFGALIQSRYKRALRHTKTRVQYTYCPTCNRTTKDYGGKKHTYHAYGTLLSDVWSDMLVDVQGDISAVIQRFADFFGVPGYKELLVLDISIAELTRASSQSDPSHSTSRARTHEAPFLNKLVKGDCLEQLRKLPDNCVDLAFADPPYNLRKVYTGYSDDLAISRYFEWCDEWIRELARIIRPGRTVAVLNIPLWAIRHFLHLRKSLTFQNWIVWDALAFPVRLLMPAHYAILCFTKGRPRLLPGLASVDDPDVKTLRRNPLHPLAQGYCLRSDCVAARRRLRVNDWAPLTDLWTDIHRLKHNTRRVDHPCQLPPQLMYRLIALLTRPGEVVLDCFNGAGTTTLAAQTLGRKYIGIELADAYHKLALQRHDELNQGLDPFRKEERLLTAKNSPVARLPKQRYRVPKKELQLDVKRIARLLGRLPTKDEVRSLSRYSFELYEKYFASWGEVCAAARTTGMSETRPGTHSESGHPQGHLF